MAEIYSTVLGAAPFVIAAYALIFLVLCGYVVFIMTKLKRTEKKLVALEEHVDALK
ncbi:MAG: CcmD family protein [Slackia sp.]